jgi:hypothetical protein
MAALPVVTSICSALAGATAVASLIAAAGRSGWRNLASARNGSMLACIALLGLSFIADVPGWAVGLDAAGFLAAVQAWALGFLSARQLRDYAAMPSPRKGEQPAWWPAFEAQFTAHTRTATHRRRLK